jgi:FkbM family methyltransferase
VPIEETWLVDPIGHAIAKLPERKLALDIGANRGDWSRELAWAFDRVIAVEPDERNPLAQNVAAGLGNVEVVTAAAWKSDGFVTLYMRPSPDQNSLLETHPIGAGACGPAPAIEQRLVPCRTLDSIAPGGADFVKIDVEGAEADILSACSREGNWSRTLFVVECHDMFDAVKAELTSLGKSVLRVPHPSPTAHPGHCWAIGTP